LPFFNNKNHARQGRSAATWYHPGFGLPTDEVGSNRSSSCNGEQPGQVTCELRVTNYKLRIVRLPNNSQFIISVSPAGSGVNFCRVLRGRLTVYGLSFPGRFRRRTLSVTAFPYSIVIALFSTLYGMGLSRGSRSRSQVLFNDPSMYLRTVFENASNCLSPFSAKLRIYWRNGKTEERRDKK